MPADGVERYAEHPALLVQTVVDTSPLDARQLVSTIRPLIHHNQWQAILGMGSSNSVILRGTGADVAAWAALITTAAENQRRFQESMEPEVQPQDR